MKSYVDHRIQTCLALVSIVSLLLLPEKPIEKQDQIGYWGPPTAVIDWCETNYKSFSFIAEPWNAITGLFLVFLSAPSIVYYYRLSRIHDVDLSLTTYMLLIQILMGVATALFHTTLWHSHQLLDEISMYFTLTAGLTVYYTRYNPKSPLHYLNFLQALVFSIIFWCSREEPDGVLHIATRIVWPIVVVSSILCIVHLSQLLSPRVGTECERLCQRSYQLLLIGIFGWLIDNCLCDLLLNVLPRYYIPYINPHGTMWHLGSFLAMHYLTTVTAAIGLVMREEQIVDIQYFAWIFPYITIQSTGKVIDSASKDLFSSDLYEM